MTINSFRLEIRCVNTGEQTYRSEPYSTFDRDTKCRPPSGRRNSTSCYTQNAFLHHDFHQSVRNILNTSPTLRQVTIMWGRCYENVPNRVVGVDLDNLPHSIDRPGVKGDGWEEVDQDW